MASNTNLESLLFRIRDGLATADEIERARELVQADPRLPDELKEVVDFEDAESDAVGLLAVLGADSLFGEILREGFEAELVAAIAEPLQVESAPEPASDDDDSITEDMLDAVWEHGAVLCDAVRYEAGEADVLGAVFAELTLELEVIPIFAAIEAEAGSVDVVDAVLVEAFGASDATFPLAAAVEHEAGSIEIADSVLAQCGLVDRPYGLVSLPIAEAIAGEAGSVDLIAAIESELTDLRLPLAEAIAYEAGTVELADQVLVAVGGEARIPVAEAVRAEAGTVDVWPELEAVVSGAWVSAMLDHELAPAAHRAAVLRLQEDPASGALMTAFASIGSELRTAVRDEAGECPYLWESIASELGVDPEAVEGWDGELFAAAVRAEAGTVDVAPYVMSQVRVPHRPSMPYSAVEVEAVPAPANSRRWNVGTLVMAAAAALLLTVLPIGYRDTLSGGSTGSNPTVEASAQFASAGEIVVENLNYHDDASVTQTLGDEGALILWVDEEATL
ncbi:MAG: hypothetical protein R3F61_01315 [Myxococcota bacterium]